MDREGIRIVDTRYRKNGRGICQNPRMRPAVVVLSLNRSSRSFYFHPQNLGGAPDRRPAGRDRNIFDVSRCSPKSPLTLGKRYYQHREVPNKGSFITILKT